MILQPGTRLGGRYELTEPIAGGGMGDVWKGRDTKLTRTVAIKVVRTRTDAEPAFAARFLDEARHTAQLSHPNIAAVYDFGEDDGVAFLVMEFIPGVPLSELVAGGPMSPGRATVLLGQCAAALAAAHQAGLVHRDVKPANIVVTPEGGVKLTDFGIARAADSAGHTRAGEVLGTPQYLAPEQAQGKPVTGATDLYSLGVVGFELVTGTRPFDAGSSVATALAHINEPPPPLPEHVGDPLRSAIEACLAKDPAQRPASAAALAAKLGMPDPGVANASLATRVIPVTERQLGADPAGGTPRTTVIENTENAQSRHPAYPPGHVSAHKPASAAAHPRHVRRGSAWWWVLPIVVVALVAALLATQGHVGESSAAMTPSATSPGPSATSSPTNTTPTVVLSDSDFIGKDVDVVRAALAKLGFTTVRELLVPSDQPLGVVLAVEPTGPAGLDDPITLFVSDGSLEPAPSSPPTPSTPPAPSIPPAPSAPSTPSTTPTPTTPPRPTWRPRPTWIPRPTINPRPTWRPRPTWIPRPTINPRPTWRPTPRRQHHHPRSLPGAAAGLTKTDPPTPKGTSR